MDRRIHQRDTLPTKRLAKGSVEFLLLEIGGVHPACANLFAACVALVKIVGRFAGVRVVVEHIPLAEHPRVALLAQFCKQLFPQRFFYSQLRLGLGQIFHAVGVPCQVIQFLLWAFAKVEVPKMIRPVAALVEDRRLGWTAVAVEVAGGRVARRPAIGLEVVQVQPVPFHNAADGIAPVVWPTDVVPLLADQNMVTAGNYAARFWRSKNVEQTPARDRLHDRPDLRHPGSLDKRRREVGETYEVLHHPTPTVNALWPADRQRDVVRRLVRLPLHAREWHAVIRCCHDQRVVQLPGSLQCRKDFTKVIVVMLHLDRVVEHVVTNHLVVRPILRDTIDVRQLFAHAPPYPVIVPAVRLSGAKPERPRLTLGLASSLEKLRKVARVIVEGDRPCRRLGLLLLPRRAGDLPGFAVGIPRETRPPAFAGVTGSVAVGLQQLDPATKLSRENRHVVASVLQLPRVAAGQDDRAGRRALGVRSVGTLKQNTLLG